MQLAQGTPVRDAAATTPTSFWHALLVRWFSQYNPLYLLSAALVLAGCFLWSRGLIQDDTLVGPLGIAFVAELYAIALIGGAALLVRIGLVRPAVMLAMIALFYQWDATLHTETCAYLGWAGTLATLAWLAIFVGKLYALRWALRLTVSRPALAAAILAAVGLALGPRILPGLGGRAAGSIVAMWVFALASLYRAHAIETSITLDAWGQTVLRRATRVAWLMSGALLAVHVLLWWRDHEISLWPLALGLPLLEVRRVRSERRTWAIAAATLAIAAVFAPSAFAVTSLLAAAVLALRLFAPAFPPREKSGAARAPRRNDADPYRAQRGSGSPEETTAATEEEKEEAPLSPGERARALAGVLAGTYLAAWTLPWSHGPWPDHVLILDAALTIALAFAFVRTRAGATLAPVAACYAHLVVHRHLIPVPGSTAAWGKTIVGAGFALLAGSLLLSYRLRAHRAASPAADRRTGWLDSA